MTRVEPTSSRKPLGSDPARLPLPAPRLLQLESKDADGSPHLAAASGVVVVGRRAWVVADDENFLAHFPLDSRGPGATVRLFPSTLPSDPKERKKEKADLEVLVHIPGPSVGVIGEGLLAIPSGSKKRRVRGAVVGVSPDGDVLTRPREIDFSPLFKSLATRFPKLNLEGAVVLGGTLRVFQRGNGAGNTSALIDLDLATVLAAVRTGTPVPASALRSMSPIDLGTVDGVPLAITDATALPDGRVVFTAAAEASADTVRDGEVVAAAVGLLSQAGDVIALARLEPTVKAEGVHARVLPDGALQLWLVTDADDRSVAGHLYQMRWDV